MRKGRETPVEMYPRPRYGHLAAEFHALNDVELEHVLTCVECERLLDEIEEVLNEIADEHRDQTID